MNLFGVLRDAQLGPRLVEMIRLSPFARSEFEACYAPTRNRLERARRLIVRSFMGHGSDGASGIYRTGFRAASNRSGTTPAHDWVNYPPALAAILERLKGVVIERRPAVQVMQRHDSLDTLHFVDPPYLHSTRARANRRPDNGGVYRHKMTEEQHIEMLGELVELKGMVVLCGYPSEIYDDLLPGWRRVEREAACRRRAAENRSALAQSRGRDCAWPWPVVRGRGMNALLPLGIWVPILDGDPDAAKIYDEHYSSVKSRERRRSRGTLQFGGPGERIILSTPKRCALFGWRRQRYRADDQVGVECFIFSNRGRQLSSRLISAADRIADERWPGERHFTFVDASQTTASRDDASEPGQCFIHAGWHPCGISAGGLHILEREAAA